MSQRFRIRADVDDLWQIVQQGPFGETEWIECSQLNHFLQTNERQKLTPGSVLGPLWRQNGTEEDDGDDHDNDDDG